VEYTLSTYDYLQMIILTPGPARTIPNNNKAPNMKLSISNKFNSGLTKVLVISGALIGLAVCLVLYLIWLQGMELIFGIPTQLLMATIVLPALLAAVLFYLAGKLEILDRLDDDDQSY
jgi:hypothetical protein